ncbi:aldo/keto reductase [Streptomyces chartreusis]|uniref:aldo/keto reductase n=1 Tax=Streptomyces chartreusis TaxID=1969 RepID=UPI002E19452B
MPVLVCPDALALAYRRCGNSGLRLPALSLALGHDLLSKQPLSQQYLVDRALDYGFLHFDLALPGQSFLPRTTPPYMRALHDQREALILSTRIGLGSGPFTPAGFGSRKHLVSGVDRVLQQTGLDYLDILFAHRHDPDTPLEETMHALAGIVRQGKALYIGLSGYSPAILTQAISILASLHTPLVACQTSFSLLDRWAQDGLLGILKQHDIGFIACAPLAHGALSFPAPAAWPLSAPADLDPTDTLNAVTTLAQARGQTTAQLAISWLLNNQSVASALLTTTDPEHLRDARDAAAQATFTPDELRTLDTYCPPPPTAEARCIRY